MSGIVSNHASVLSRCGALAGRLAGDRQACAQFRPSVRGSLAAVDGVARTEVERLYGEVGEVMAATVQVMSGLSGFLRVAAGRIAEVDAAAAGSNVATGGGS
ncbi:MAG: hypothetical protein FWD83_03950 [Promicromonosporaceae bacterium]|nr:hypothetical protein [Promicromonosporaceae bacterium]